MVAVLILIILLKIFSLTSCDQMLETVQRVGISIDCHYVITEDGYILRLYHIPPASNTSIDRTSLKPMLFMHGLQSSSLDFVFYPNHSVGHYFHNQGYDVWLGNARGNTFSRNHTTLDPNNATFWKFSWHEIGVYDLPAIIDYILEKTKQPQLIYTGYSQGGTIMFVLLSEHPEYNKKIAWFHSMAGAVYYTNTNTALDALVDNIEALQNFVDEIQLYEVNSFNNSRARVQFLGTLCSIPVFRDICEWSIGKFFGAFSTASYYDDLLLDYSKINPSGASYMQYIHYLQIYKSGKFHRFDHGPDENMMLYQSPTPPLYNLSNVETKMHLMFGSHDSLVSPKGTLLLSKKLKHSMVIMNQFRRFNHLDFVLGQRVHTVNPIMMQAIKEFT